ncbi:hypothetical protein N7456_005291 [Penicillium angulare]|uniref:Cytochrome P450 n=1 Tax=Penicillium angulare TaxID=116970 RepID=A0A9W9KK13_9EURO|nr:hypothetical protein N7456_005291 [Penicillium angulare]
MADSVFWPLVGVVLMFLMLHGKTNPRLKHIPIVRYSNYLPTFVNRILYYPRAASMIYWGYEKYRNSAFRMLTGDGEVVVLPVRYLSELRYSQSSVISGLHAQYENALGDYTNLLINSHIPSMTVRKRLTPQLARVIPWIIDELRYSFDVAIPECEDHWVPVKPHEMFVNLIARTTSRVVAGEGLRRNEEWLEAASSYSVNVGLTVLLLRPVPTYLRPLVARFLPPVQQMESQLQFVKDLFIPIINERRAAHERAVQENDPGYVAPDDLLQWMMDMAETKEDRDPEVLAHHVLLLMSLAVVHTSAMAMCHALYDLLLRPEYIAPLREEIMTTLADGWENATKRSFDNQKRLDSFLRESQRFGSPGELSFHRIVMEPLTLSDGLFLPVGTHICFPSGPISKDPAHVEIPEIFDGFRWCQNPTDRNALTGIAGWKTPVGGKHNGHSSGDERIDQQRMLKHVPSTSTSFVSISASSMHFGAGAQACPGRFFAGCSIKAIFSKIIMDYDFKYEEGRGNWRPANICVGEHILPNTSTTVMFRKRSIEV